MTTGEPLRRLSQHCQTLRLLGVDAAPVYRVPAPDGHDAPAPRADRVREVKPTPAVAHPAGEAVAGVRAAAWGGARTPADAQRDLDEVRARYERDAPHDAFVTEFTNIVFGEGDPDADLMFIGEAPGADEDRTGRPFVGRAGQLLDKMIVAMGLTREAVYIANVLKTRPPNNATPTTEEARACAPYLMDQVRVVRPRVIVTLGLPATRVILDSTETMGHLRGRWARLDLPASERYPAHASDVMPTYHPAYLLRAYTPENRGKVWSDLQMAMQRLREG